MNSQFLPSSQHMNHRRVLATFATGQMQQLIQHHHHIIVPCRTVFNILLPHHHRPICIDMLHYQQAEVVPITNYHHYENQQGRHRRRHQRYNIAPPSHQDVQLHFDDDVVKLFVFFFSIWSCMLVSHWLAKCITRCPSFPHKQTATDKWSFFRCLFVQPRCNVVGNLSAFHNL